MVASAASYSTERSAALGGQRNLGGGGRRADAEAWAPASSAVCNREEARWVAGPALTGGEGAGAERHDVSKGDWRLQRGARNQDGSYSKC